MMEPEHTILQQQIDYFQSVAFNHSYLTQVNLSPLPTTRFATTKRSLLTLWTQD